MELYYRLGHDYCNFPPETGLHQTDCLEADDTGVNNAAGRREWLDGDHGVVMSRRDFDRYPWPTVGDWCCERFTEYVRHLPDGMRLVIRPTGVFVDHVRLERDGVPTPTIEATAEPSKTDVPWPTPTGERATATPTTSRPTAGPTSSPRATASVMPSATILLPIAHRRP